MLLEAKSEAKKKGMKRMREQYPFDTECRAETPPFTVSSGGIDDSKDLPYCFLW